MSNLIQRQTGLSPLFNIWMAIRYQWKTICVSVCVVLVLSICMLFFATPKFSAAAYVLIDPKRNPLLSSQQVSQDNALDQSTVESQVEVIKSRSVLEKTITSNSLIENPDFRKEVSRFTSVPATTSDELIRAINALQNMLRVRRIGLTFVLEISVNTTTPRMAAELANMIAAAYIASEVEAKYASVDRASVWLKDRIKELRNRAIDADAAVREYKAKNGLIAAGQNLLIDQQLTEMNNQLALSHVAVTEARARMLQAAEISKNKIDGAILDDTVKSDSMAKLRSQAIDTDLRISELAKKYGEDHPAVQELKTRLVDIQKSMRKEAERVAERYKDELAIATEKQASTARQLAVLIQQSNQEGKAQVGLKDLESTSTTYRVLYDAFLQKANETFQQQNFPLTEARIISIAETPTKKSFPQSTLTLVGAIFCGLTIGIGISLAKQIWHPKINNQDDLRLATGWPCFGMVELGGGRQAQSALSFVSPDDSRTIEIRPDSGALINEMRCSEVFRSIRIQSETRICQSLPRIIMVGSLTNNEGRESIALNLAVYLASSGKKTLYAASQDNTIDLFPSNSSAMTSPNSSNSNKLEQSLWSGVELPIWALPHGDTNQLVEDIFVGSSDNGHPQKRDLGTLDYIILSLPAMNSGGNLNMLSSMADVFVFVSANFGNYVNQTAQVVNNLSIKDGCLIGTLVTDLGRAT